MYHHWHLGGGVIITNVVVVCNSVQTLSSYVDVNLCVSFSLPVPQGLAVDSTPALLVQHMRAPEVPVGGKAV